jgi:hypothetical protein
MAAGAIVDNYPLSIAYYPLTAIAF